MLQVCFIFPFNFNGNWYLQTTMNCLECGEFSAFIYSFLAVILAPFLVAYQIKRLNSLQICPTNDDTKALCNFAWPAIEKIAITVSFLLKSNSLVE